MIILHYIEAEYPRIAPIGKNKGGQDTEERCLARTVRSYDAEYLPLGNPERDSPQSLSASVPLDDIICLDAIHGLKLQIAVHAYFDITVIDKRDLDGIDQIGPLVTGLDSLWGKL